MTPRKWFPESVWGLCANYNTARGKVLDGLSVSRKSTVKWQSGEKHEVKDGTIHHKIMNYLETCPGRRARFEDIAAKLGPYYGTMLDDYLREMVEQEICENVPPVI